MKLGQLIDIIKGNIFSKYFESLEGLIPFSKYLLIYQPALIIE